MNTIIVDDELWSVEQFKVECDQIAGISLIGYFDNPLLALEFAKTNRIDFALLDIEMPEIDGIELARMLKNLYPQIIIVFVTAFEKYLPDFIKLRGDYYVLKPYTKEDVEDVIGRTKLLSQRQVKRVKIDTFGQFEVFIDGKPAIFNGKKVKELFALLVDKRGKTLQTEEAFSRLWEGEEYNNINANKYRRLWTRVNEFLEKFNLKELIHNDNGNRSLNCELVDCDYFKFLSGDTQVIKYFSFAYMTDYYWAEETLAELTEIKYSYDNS